MQSMIHVFIFVKYATESCTIFAEYLNSDIAIADITCDLEAHVVNLKFYVHVLKRLKKRFDQ